MKYAIISDDALVRSFQSGDSSSLSKLSDKINLRFMGSF